MKEEAMRVLALYDAQGNIHGIATSPAGAPPGAVSAESGLLVTEVEAPAQLAKTDLYDPDPHHQHVRHNELVGVLERFRVEVRREAKLVRKPPPPSA
jgi:hypothetical protein